mmetsp:Transcript_105732/g.341042  ORF Transcript_105732/g.341042 Transcript_105732/m.341042 type:complete len:300 (+) Transcript_105732:1146-2045(+)
MGAPVCLLDLQPCQLPLDTFNVAQQGAADALNLRRVLHLLRRGSHCRDHCSQAFATARWCNRLPGLARWSPLQAALPWAATHTTLKDVCRRLRSLDDHPWAKGSSNINTAALRQAPRSLTAQRDRDCCSWPCRAHSWREADGAASHCPGPGIGASAALLHRGLCGLCHQPCTHRLRCRQRGACLLAPWSGDPSKWGSLCAVGALRQHGSLVRLWPALCLGPWTRRPSPRQRRGPPSLRLPTATAAGRGGGLACAPSDPRRIVAPLPHLAQVRGGLCVPWRCSTARSDTGHAEVQSWAVR